MISLEYVHNGKMVKVVEQRGTCWLADDDLTFEYSGKSMSPQKIPSLIQEIKKHYRKIYWNKIWCNISKLLSIMERVVWDIIVTL